MLFVKCHSSVPGADLPFTVLVYDLYLGVASEIHILYMDFRIPRYIQMGAGDSCNTDT
jgi:hypothetical protein